MFVKLFFTVICDCILRFTENPDLVKPVVTIIDGKKLTTEFVLLELAAIERKVNAEIESESCIPIINKVFINLIVVYVSYVLA